MIWRVRYETLGGHVHCRLFAAKEANQTFASCGGFIVRVEEFESLQAVCSGIVFLPTEKVTS